MSWIPRLWIWFIVVYVDEKIFYVNINAVIILCYFYRDYHFTFGVFGWVKWQKPKTVDLLDFHRLKIIESAFLQSQSIRLTAFFYDRQYIIFTCNQIVQVIKNFSVLFLRVQFLESICHVVNSLNFKIFIRHDEHFRN